MKKVTIEPGACGFVAQVEAQRDKKAKTVTLKVTTGCPNITQMVQTVGDTFDAYALCLTKPGTGPLYDYAREKMPAHASCPVLVGILKCAEAECGLAVTRDAVIRFEA